MSARTLSLLAASIAAMLVMPLAAQPTVYRCETNGKVSYSDAPCVGAKVIDATPTQGMDKMTGQSRKGRDVQREEFNAVFDNSLRPLHGRSHADMDVMRRRVKLSSPVRQSRQPPTHEVRQREALGQALRWVPAERSCMAALVEVCNGPSVPFRLI